MNYYVTWSTCTFQVEPDTETVNGWRGSRAALRPIRPPSPRWRARLSVGRRSRPGNRGAPTPGRKILGVTPEVGGRYFHGYGELTGEMWREFGAALTAFAVERETQDRIVENAIATFRRLRGWFQRVHVS